MTAFNLSSAPPDPYVYAEVADGAGVPHTYRIALYPARKGLAHGLALGRIVGGPVGQVLAGLSDGGLEGNVPHGDLAAALAEIPQRLIEAGSGDLFTRLLEGAERQDPSDGERWDKVSNGAIFDVVYRGNYVEALGALWEVLKANYSPFSGGTGPAWLTQLIGFAERAVPAMKARTTGDTAPSGTTDGAPG